mmetsp:Transcript_34778/g.92148  ORF Transcript_34778/g.92148 Transcript_34778/m.92148 type:complete len:382 (+) Transcript_34778:726-1871(+)
MRLGVREEQQDDCLVRVDAQVVPAVVQLGGDGCLTQRVDPLQAPVLRLAVVEVVEDLDRLLHLRAEVRVLHLVRRPVARRQHRRAEVDAAERPLALRQPLAMLPELLLEIGGQGQVVDHALKLGRELRSALHLQLRDHALLGVLRGRGLVEQALRQLVPVDLREQVLVAEEREEFHHLREEDLNLVVGEALAGLLQDPVAEGGHQRGEGVLADVTVDEDFEGLLERLLEQRVLREALLHNTLESVVEVQERLDKRRVPQSFGLGGHLLRLLHALVDDLVAPVGDVLPEGLRDGVEAVVDQGEHPVHTPQVLALVVVEQVDDAGLLLQELRLGLCEKRLDDHVLQLGVRRPVQVVGHPLLLGIQGDLGLAEVLREGVLGQPA